MGGDLVISILVVAKLTVRPHAHHHVLLQLLLLSGVQLSILVVAVIFFLFSVLVIFVSIAETRFSMPVLAMLSKCILRRELFLAGVQEHVMVLRCHHLLGREALPIELVRVELHDCVRATRWRHSWLHGELLWLEVACIWLLLRCLHDWLCHWSHLHGFVPGAPFLSLCDLERLAPSRWSLRMYDVYVCRAVLSSLQLLPIELIILLLEFPHFFDFVEVDDKASFQIVQVLNALSTEN